MISVNNLTIRQGAFRLDRVTFRVPTGNYAVLMGKTGSGKTSVLESIAGLRRISAGRIELAGIDVTNLPPGARNIGYVPQDAALFPTMSVSENLSLAMRVRGTPRAEIEDRIDFLSEWLRIDHLLERYPAKLSGGEAQRVALGRALAHSPPVLLLDEPLSALDEDTRDEIYELLDSVRESGRVTVLHITHNRSEAEKLGDIKLRLTNGQIIEEPNQ